MANPPKFTPGYSYSGWQASNPTKPLPAAQVDNDFANIETSLNAAIDGLSDVRRSDGALANQSVGPDQLSAALSIGFTFRGAWADGTTYSAGDGVVYSGVFYSAKITHTASGANDPPDSATWNVLFGVDDIAVAGSLAMPRDGFTGDGSTKRFGLSFVPLSSRNLLVSVGGVLQSISEYTVDGSDIVFTVAPPAGYEIEVRGFATTATTTVPEDGSVTEAKLADGAVTTVKLADEAATIAKLGADVIARIPPVAANTLVVGNADGTANVTKTFAETKTLLGLDELVVSVVDRDAMQLASTESVVIVKDDARGGIFDWSDADLTAEVTADPGAIAVVPPTADPTGASGARIWRKMSRITPRRAGALGALGDGSLDVVGGVPCPDDIVAMQRAMAWAAAEGAILEIDRPYRVGHTTRDENLFSNIGPAQLLTHSNQYIEWLADGWIYPCGYSRSGSIFTNLITQADPNSIQNNLRFINSQIDMSGYKPFRFTGQVVSADGLGTYFNGTTTIATTRVKLNTPLVGDPLPAGRGSLTFYNYACEIVSGTGAGQNAFIKGYDEANKRFTLNELWPIEPDATSIFRLGSNDNPYGLNPRDLQILGGLIRNVPLGVFGAGGKAINLENGPKDCIVADVKAENIEGVAFFVQGHPGVQTNGAKRWAQNITFQNCSAEDCGALLAVLALDAVNDPDGSPVDNHVTMKNMWGKRVGHYPGRILASDHQKSAAIILAEAGPTKLRDISIDNTSFVPDYSGLYPEQNGYGMTGPVGAIGIIWGRSCDIDGIRAWGNFDNGFMFQRWRAGGDDGSDVDTPSVIQNTYRIDIRNVFHSGVFTSEAALPEAERRTGFLASMNPWIDTGSGYPGTTIRPTDAEVRVRFQNVSINADFELLPAHMAPYTGIIFENVTDWLQKTQINGPLSAAEIYAFGNTVAKVRVAEGVKISATIADDAVLDIVPPFTPGIFNFRIKKGSSVSGGVAGRVQYSVSSTAQCESLGIGANVVLGTTALTDGTGGGTDVKLNIAAVLATGHIQMKNRMGASRDWEYWFE